MFAPVREISLLAGIAVMGVLVAHNVWSFSPETLLTLGSVALSMVFLTIGLGLDPKETREHWRFVALVLLIGVPAKFGLTLWLTGAIGGSPDATTVMTISQVDAISVALIMANPWMSLAAKAAMGVIALSDDPWTGLLAEAMNAANGKGVEGLVPYMSFFVVVMLLVIIWLAKRSWLTSAYQRITGLPDWALTALLIGGVATAATAKWYFVAAIVGLFIRPAWLGHDDPEEQRTWEKMVNKATLWAAFSILGFALAGGGLTENPYTGAVMGSTIVISHALVLAVLLLAYRIPFIGGEAGKSISTADALFMMASHQNGLTAISLALGLGLAVGVVAVSVITTFVWYMALNIGLFTYYARKGGKGELLRT